MPMNPPACLGASRSTLMRCAGRYACRRRSSATPTLRRLLRRDPRAAPSVSKPMPANTGTATAISPGVARRVDARPARCCARPAPRARRERALGHRDPRAAPSPDGCAARPASVGWTTRPSPPGTGRAERPSPRPSKRRNGSRRHDDPASEADDRRRWCRPRQARAASLAADGQQRARRSPSSPSRDRLPRVASAVARLDARRPRASPVAAFSALIQSRRPVRPGTIMSVVRRAERRDIRGRNRSSLVVRQARRSRFAAVRKHRDAQPRRDTQAPRRATPRALGVGAAPLPRPAPRGRRHGRAACARVSSARSGSSGARGRASRCRSPRRCDGEPIALDLGSCCRCRA